MNCTFRSWQKRSLINKSKIISAFDNTTQPTDAQTWEHLTRISIRIRLKIISIMVFFRLGNLHCANYTNAIPSITNFKSIKNYLGILPIHNISFSISFYSVKYSNWFGIILLLFEKLLQMTGMKNSLDFVGIPFTPHVNRTFSLLWWWSKQKDNPMCLDYGGCDSYILIVSHWNSTKRNGITIKMNNIMENIFVYLTCEG